ncbi:hypothetical protein HYH03_004723 [Edaphochlamys debaryana]|uniref:Glycosyl transferase CAP10 domain-containing protein n=1 Tax=Edaphochlamys debaryana TaxID=47281 RepID=A0A835Y6B0_9CHLO|nr:hypothetical protein HYH03_004723 [Edaphochlamys debaryana]|eukprot:KAG2497132.1 hypothetical protein HYH03_004723 [Edaphochlamys debaryana]
MLWKNRLYWVQRDKVDSVGEAPELASTLHECFGRRVTRWLQSGLLQLPDVIFLLNVDDNAPRVCGPGKTCAVHPLSVGKTIDHTGPDEDILVPQLMWQSNSYHYAAWGLKKDVAFFRGNTFCSGKWVNPVPNCSVACPRNYLAWRSDRDARDNRQPRYLEAGIVEKADMWWLQDTNPLSRAAMEACNPEPLPILDRVPMAEHAKYKYLLHLEGITYSSRLNQLMLTNSLVLLQRQPFVEYFYRSLRPGVHYVPFWNVTPNATAGRLDDIYDVIDDLRRRDHADPRDLQRIIAAAQDFAHKFTTGSGRARYLREALTRYKSLFSDMDPYLEQFVAGLKAKGYMQPTNGTLLTNGSVDAHG